MPSKYFAATGKTKASFSLIDGSNRPTLFVGGVTVSNTKDRPNPPNPICGLDLSSTSLGNGHIMALQLGGPDYSENIVPQYQQWQQSGRWRVLEKDAMAHCAAGNWIFVARMHYANTHKSGKDHRKEFTDGNTTIFWDDPLIPTTFDIWLIDAGSGEGKAIQKDILAPAVTDAERVKAAQALPTLLDKVARFRTNDDQAVEMPEEDRDYWRKNQLAQVVAEMYDEYKVDRQEQLATATKLAKAHDIGSRKERSDMMDVMMSPLRETEVEFVQGYGDVVRQELDSIGWLPAEIVEYGSNSNMLEAVFHEKTLPARTVKANAARVKKYNNLHSGSAARREKYSARYSPYGRMTETFSSGLKGDRFKTDTNETYKSRLDRFNNGMGNTK